MNKNRWRHEEANILKLEDLLSSTHSYLERSIIICWRRLIVFIVNELLRSIVSWWIIIVLLLADLHVAHNRYFGWGKYLFLKKFGIYKIWTKDNLERRAWYETSLYSNTLTWCMVQALYAFFFRFLCISKLGLNFIQFICIVQQRFGWWRSFENM